MELIVPTLGESITEATVSKWLKKVGDSFEADEPLVEIETDKITVEVPAPSAGSISEIKVEEGADVNIGGVLALGCTIGQGVTGISTLALGSFITLIFIILGAAITMKIEFYNAVYEAVSYTHLTLPTKA